MCSRGVHPCGTALRNTYRLLARAVGVFSPILLLQVLTLPLHACSWQKGINRVVVWSFENMYGEGKCYELFRFRKEDMRPLLHELELPVGVDGNLHTPDRCTFDPMEALCTFLLRMAHCDSWDVLIVLLGGASRVRYMGAFYVVLHHLFSKFIRCINDIRRWEGNCDEFAGGSCSLSLMCPLFLAKPARHSSHPLRSMCRRWPSLRRGLQRQPALAS